MSSCRHHLCPCLCIVGIGLGPKVLSCRSVAARRRDLSVWVWTRMYVDQTGPTTPEPQAASWLRPMLPSIDATPRWRSGPRRCRRQQRNHRVGPHATIEIVGRVPSAERHEASLSLSLSPEWNGTKKTKTTEKRQTTRPIFSHILVLFLEFGGTHAKAIQAKPIRVDTFVRDYSSHFSFSCSWSVHKRTTKVRSRPHNHHLLLLLLLLLAQSKTLPSSYSSKTLPSSF